MQKYCENISKFEVGYTQTFASLEVNTMWHPKGGHCNVLSPIILMLLLDYFGIL
jgi:hypothetical protein